MQYIFCTNHCASWCILLCLYINKCTYDFDYDSFGYISFIMSIFLTYERNGFSAVNYKL